MKRLSTALLLLVASACSGDDPPPLCTSDANCAGEQRCLPDGSCDVVDCVEPIECTSVDPRTTCDPESFACVYREGFGDDCDASRPCPFGEFCSELLGLCLDSSSSRECTRRSQCPANQICDRGANKCVPDYGCYGDAFCEPGEVCDVVNRTCGSASDSCLPCDGSGCEEGFACVLANKECVPAGSDPICRQGEFCDPLGRCVQCANDGDCGPGTFCNVSTGACESSVQCADDPSECPSSTRVQCIVCQRPEVCNSRTRRCAAPPEPCESDLECPNDQLCDLALDPPVCVPRLPDCIGDVYDSPRNDDPASARGLAPEDGPRYSDLRLCPGDQDWFRLDVPAGTLLTVDARFTHREGDLELQLYLEDGRTVVDQSRSTTDNERVELEVGTDLSLLVRTFLGTQTVRPLTYALVVGMEPGSPCEDDEAEPSDGPAQATPLNFSMPFDGRVCPADPDWFVLRNVPEGSQVELQLDFVDALGNLDVEVFRGGTSAPIAVGRGTADGEKLTFDAPFGGEYFVRVLGASGDGNVYRLRATLRADAGGRCRDDRLEPNESPDMAGNLSAQLGQPLDLTLCGGDEDWFEVDIDAFGLLEASIAFDGLQDLDLALYPPGTLDRDVSPLAVSDRLAPREYIAHRPTMSGTYLLRVYGRRDSDISAYTLLVKSGPLEACSPDTNDLANIGNDPNDPVPLGFPPTASRDATLCSTDEDFYRLFVEGGFRTTLRLEYPGSLATLEYELLDANGETLLSTVGQALSGLREVNLNVPGNGVGVVVVRVFSNDGREAAYTLSADAVPVFACEPDPAEPNEDALTASTLTATTASPILFEGTLCSATRRVTSVIPPETVGDADYFVLNPPSAGTRIEAAVAFDSGDLLLELLAPGGESRACANDGNQRCYSDGDGLSERISFTVSSTGAYILRVDSVNSSKWVPSPPPGADTGYRLEVLYDAP